MAGYPAGEHLNITKKYLPKRQSKDVRTVSRFLVSRNNLVSAILRRAMPMKNWLIKAAVMLLIIAMIFIVFAPMVH